MVNFLKKYWIVILIIAVIAILVVLWFTRRKNISFDFALPGDFSKLLGILSAAPPTADFQASGPAADFQKGIGVYLDVPLTTIINNNNAASMTLKNIIGSISYNGEPILQTKADSAVLQDIKVPSKTSLPVTDSVQVLVNPSSIKFFTELVKGNKPSVKYNMKATVFGVPYNFTNSTTVNK